MMIRTTFDGRLSVGRAGQAELQAVLERRGFEVFVTGQEHLLSPAVHAALRYEHADPMARAVRFAPDLLAYRADFPLAYWEAKVNTTPGTPNFAIEKACYEEQLARVEKGERVVIAFLDVDRLWRANWVGRLGISRDMSARRHAARGSQTPYVLVWKASTLPLAEFMQASAGWRSG
jgi:hypothetical protein